ncbi:GWxTD domain-containing protein [Hymenobacter endophyticus]|uniref:GWxTD domain-containing protein n=1 Tax=Hymenobacter endophyticus TaxID=3076335 RepID=A0ABU3TKC8_9BACT|nr:GWxTD domain-containing protein [Hymenobacter endophyticus]MDU0371823.1 GWxTD domain-containing protein [Hymenobacter endophyticus]
MKYALLLSLLFTWATGALHANPRRDFATQYRPERRILVDTRREDDSVRVYLRFTNPSDQASIRSGQPLHVLIWPSVDAKRPLRQLVIEPMRIKRFSVTTVAFLLPVSYLRAGWDMSVGISTAENAASGDAAWLHLSPESLTHPFILIDTLSQPLMRRYVHAQEVFCVGAYFPEQTLLTVYRYPLSSVAAAPPMAASSTQGTSSRVLRVQDSAVFQTNLGMKLPAGLFLLRLNGSPVRSGLLVEENQFPELTTADELIAPLIYLTTSQERQKLFDAPDPKKAVDQFWLTVAGNSQPIARQLIRTYYGRVAEASQLFSAHKAGWLTDRGLLYLVLGPPESVYREAGTERWVYRADVERSGTFIFRAKPSTFAPDNYELVRRPEYEQLWYAAVEQWRKGRTARPGR